MAINFPDSPTSGDTHTVGDKTWTWNGTSWDVVVSTPISNQIIDADGDTRIQVEESPDEDYIRFDTAGTERMTIGPTGDVAVTNDLSVTGTISGGSTSFPTSLDSGTMPAIEALQAKVGADSSAVTSSLDYKVADHASRITTLEGAPAPAAGLTLIKKVTFSGVTSFSEDNVFTSAYDNYLILISGTSSSASDTQFRLRVGGVDATSSNYFYEGLNVTGTSVGGFSGTTTVFTMGSDSTTRFDHSTQIFGPAIADRTGWLSWGHRDGARIGFYGSEHTLTTAYDGFTILDNVGTITGTLWLYGYDKD